MARVRAVSGWKAAEAQSDAEEEDRECLLTALLHVLIEFDGGAGLDGMRGQRPIFARGDSKGRHRDRSFEANGRLKMWRVGGGRLD